VRQYRLGAGMRGTAAAADGRQADDLMKTIFLPIFLI
jgi:hypothetical protein